MALPNTRTVTVDSVLATDVVIQRINQDNNGVTWFVKDETGNEYKCVLRRNLQQPDKVGSQKERHILDMTWTEFSDLGVPTVYQMYSHLVIPRGSPPQKAADLVAAFTGFNSVIRDGIVAWET